MTIQSNVSSQIPKTAEALILCLSDKKTETHEAFKQLSKAMQNRLKARIKAKEITGKEGDINECGDMGGIDRLITIGIGDKETLEGARRLGGNIARYIEKIAIKKADIICSESLYKKEDPKAVVQALSEGIKLGTYTFDKYKTKPEKKEKKSICIHVLSSKKITHLNNVIETATIDADGVGLARDLANEPANILTPKEMVARVKKHCKGKHTTIEVIDKVKAKRLKMNAFLGVAQGSALDPYVVIIRYKGGKSTEKPLALVGKGVTFDTGGISIKPSKGMKDMKGDMGGAAAVIGAMHAIIKRQPKKNVTAIIPLVENMPSGTAQRPGDIVTAMNGKTIEITNTDAEGRLILADALCYAVKHEKATKIIDLATLTGACSVALGQSAIAVLGNNQGLIDSLKKVGEKTGERLWQLPLFDDYFDLLKSDVADMINASETRLAGTVTAAKFLEQFVDKTPWAHLDIAATMDYSKTSGYQVKGMSGVAARTLVQFICDN